METNAEQEALWNQMAQERTEPAAEKPPVEPAPEPVLEAPETPTPEPAPEEPSSPDVLGEIRDQLTRLTERTRQVEGHIGGLTAAQKRFTEEVRAAATARAAVENAPTAAAVTAAAEDPADWAALKNDFPEWAKATESLLNSRLATASPKGYSTEDVAKLVEERVSTVSAQLRNEAIDLALDAQFPGWKNEVRTPEFSAWFAVQPENIQALEKSPAIGDAVRLLRAYEEARSTPNPLVASRAKKLEAAAALPKGVTAAPAKTVDEMTMEELWAHEAKKREEARKNLY